MWPIKSKNPFHYWFAQSARVLVAITFSILVTFPAATAQTAEWQSIEQEARGQTVYFYAWAGDPRMNAFISWAAQQVQQQYGVTVQHVKIADAAEIVTRVLAQKQAGNDNNGSGDLIWLNGENFAAMKTNNLLHPAWTEGLPNYALLDAANNPDLLEDFTVPVEGLESPWARAQLVFYFDSELISSPPRSIAELLQFAQQHPGEFTYPRPPNFLGSTFLKQALLELTDSPQLLYAPMQQADFAAVSANLWEYLDSLHPLLLRSGRYFPASGPELRRLMGDSEIALALSFNPFEAVAGIASGELPDSVRAYVLENGTVSNINFVTIPFNAQHAAGAMVLANFLLSPLAQSHAQDPAVLGNTTVLAVDKLPAAARALFREVDLGPAFPSADELQRKLPEPHPSWMPALEQEWLSRYSGRQ